MKIHLLYKDQDIATVNHSCFDWEEISKDLETDVIINTMSKNDKIVENTCIKVLSNPLTDINAIRYRQDNLRDALANSKVIRELYSITLETEQKIKELYYWLDSNFLSSTFSSAINRLLVYTEMLKRLREIADLNITHFNSKGFHIFFSMLKDELSDEYLHKINEDLNDLKVNKGTIISASMGADLQGINYALCKRNPKGFFKRWTFAPSYILADRDNSGSRDFGDRCDRAINESTNVLAKSAEYLSDFFLMLRTELAFYIGCINLSEALEKCNMPFCFPLLTKASEKSRSYENLYDTSLALTKASSVVSNNLLSQNKSLYIVTGANQGGKTTFLRSIGQAQYMAQCGMFTAASSICIPIRQCIFTHFKKEEDINIKSGKLDEELTRMDKLIAHIKPDSLILSNESFSSTNEQEGSEIFKQITDAVICSKIELFSVTHIYSYAVSYLSDECALFLRAGHLDNGARTFKITEGSPLQTAFGQDLYEKIFVPKS